MNSLRSLPVAERLTPESAAAALIERKAARSSLLAFTCRTHAEYQAAAFHRRLCGYLDAFIAGTLRRLIINMPPRHGKSELVSRRLPAYILGRNPDASVIACSYSADLASRMNRDVQRIMDEASYQRLFPETRLHAKNIRTVAHGSWLRNSDVFEVVGRRGVYRSAGRGQGITGMGGDYLIIDDILKDREEADSPTVRESCWEWYTSTFRTRLAPGGSILITMTRWHEDDLVGRLIAQAREEPKADQWHIVCLPALCEEPGPDDPRAIGEVLWPERYPLAELEKIRVQSEYDWQALYQQRPRPEGGVEWPDTHFPASMWFEEWPRLYVKAMALDPSKGKSDKVGDYSAYVWGGLDTDQTLWIDADLARRHTGRMVEDGLRIFREFAPQAFAVEINSYQELLGGEFLRAAGALRLPLPVYGITNTTPKPVRIRTLGPWLGQKRLRVRNTPGGRLLVKQLRDFPVGDHDDGPDAAEMLTRMLAALLGERSELGAPRLIAS